MANGNDGASVLIDVGVDIGSSYTSFSEGIKTLIEEINKNPPKIRVELDLGQIKSSSIRSQLEQELNGRGSGGKLASTIDASTLTKTAEGVKSASDEILRLKNETKSLNTTLNTASKRLSSLGAELTKVRNPKTGETSISDTTKQLIDLQNKMKEIAGTNKSLSTQYFGLKSNLGGEAATGQNAIDVEALKNKYLELAKAFEFVKVKGASASAEELQNVYNLQGEMGKLISQVKERMVAEKDAAAAAAAADKSRVQNNAKIDAVDAKRYSVLKSTVTLLGQAEDAESKWTAAQYGKSSDAYARIQKIVFALTAYKEELSSLDRNSDTFAADVQEINNKVQELTISFKNNAREIKANGEATRTFAERIGSLASKFANWLSITRVLMATVKYIKQAVNAVIEIDTAMTELKKVTDETSATYDRFLDNAVSRAKNLGTTVSDIVTATADFARLGYGIQDASALADAAVIYKNVGDGIADINEASESIIATMQAFGVSAENVMQIVDKFNEVGNRFAISSKGVGDALLRSAAAMHAAGNDINETIALATAANTIIQNPDSVGTALKTVSMYLRAAKTEAEEAGEATDGMANSVSELRDELLSLTGGKVDIQVDENSFKNTYQVLKELSQVWSDLSDISRANITEMIGGKRNANIISAILNNFTIAENALQTAADSAGSAMEENEKYLESIQGHIAEFKTALEALGEDLVGSDFVKEIIDLGTWFIGLLDSVAKLIDKFGGLNSILVITIGLLTTLNSRMIADKYSVLASDINGFLHQISLLPSAFKVAKQAGTGFGSAMTAAGFSINKVALAIGAASAAVSIAVSSFQSYRQHLKEVAGDAEVVATKSSENAEALLNLRQQLVEGVKSTNELTDAFRSQLDAMGYTSEQIDSLIEKYHGLSGAIRAVSDAAQRQAAADAFKNIKAQEDSIEWDSLFDQMFSYNMNSLRELPYEQDFKSTLKVFEKVPNILERTQELSKTMDEWLSNQNTEKIIDVYSQLQALQSDMNKASYFDSEITTTSYYKNVEKAIDRIEDKYLNYINTVKDSSETIASYLTDSFSASLSSDEAEVFNNVLSSVGASLGNIESAELFAKDLSKDIREIFGSESLKNMQEMAQKVADGAIDINVYATALERLREDYAGEDPLLFDAIFAYLENLPKSLQVSEEAVEDLGYKLHNISEVFEQVDDWANVAAQASVEMAETGEISADTVKAMAELVGEGEDWVKYLKIENGELKLNVDLWKEKALETLNADISALEDELSVLQSQNDELITKLALQQELAKQNESMTQSARSAYETYKASFPANPTQSDIERLNALYHVAYYYDTIESAYQVQIDDISNQIEEHLKLLEAYRAGRSSYDKAISDALDKANGNKDNEESLKVFNWIEAKLDRIQRKVNEFSRVVGSKFKSLSTRNEAAKKEIEAITEEIELQEKAYRKYIELCETINLSDEIKQTIQNGAIDISEYDEETAELISQYQEWYEAALDTKDAVDELHESLASMYDDEFNRIQTDFENRISLLEYLTNMYNTGISQLETEGYMASTEFYKALTESTEHNIDLLKEELGGLESALQAALNSGEIEIYSEAWYGYITTMNGVKEAIADANLSLAEFAKTMQEIDWEYFDYLQERISNITDESEFLLDLLGEDNIFKDGKLTAEGLSALGLRAVNYNVYMAQADKYAQEIAEIEQQLANDPNNKTLLDRREELLELQRQSILAAEDEKNAILDLVKTAIEEELDSIKELIEAYKDALDAAKDLYDYRQKISDETSEISSLQKQIFAYSGDNSEESRATIQQLKDQLVKAQKELEETEYDKYISDQKKLLDNLYAEYELLLNQRLDNTDALLADIIAMVNQNANVISDTLHMTADSVGYNLSDSMQTVWSTSFGTLQSVVTMYGEGFLSQLTTVNQALNNISNLVSSMQSYGNSWAQGWIGGVNNSYVPDYSGWTPGGYGDGYGGGYTGGYDSGDTEYIDPSYSSPSPAPVKQITVGGQINAAGATIYRRSDRSDGGTTQYFGSDPIYTVLSQEQNKYGETMLLVRHRSQSSGNTGWFRMSDVRAYKHGGLVDQTGLVWLDGTKQKPETVLDAEDTQRFQTLVDAMDKAASQGLHMKDLGSASRLISRLYDRGRAEITPIRNPAVPMSQEIAITIPIDHVYDYDDFINQLRSDKNGKRIIQSLALDGALGKNSLGVNRYMV